ncbi:lysylphosphatidylglycerol synthase transmembrane domain-containing protein [Roseiflexus sp. RS-1]|jgi:hypothetical protein|uniref:lysylphosphatidylglycerol synthase transmembrane domain-containing protein n=1 Tax=Roseiflexus sp. (strain RS-1) TaxID=357808 RepID=UPI0001534045|nr:lysylphosphatidylglycerol synthase transmembrane domain-containing protein [Roseiflexus sp. RS-1]ABQ92746.1 hypothetical protein RoseRS_4413 [Roseiflexus sp. RS-1]
MKKTILRVLFTIFLFVLLINQVDFSEKDDLLIQISPIWMVLAILMNIFALLTIVWRWKVIINGMGVHKSFLDLFYINLVSTFFGMFLPSSVGGDVSKMIMVAENTLNREAAASSVLIDRMIGMIITTVIGIVSLFFLSSLRDNRIIMGSLVVTLLIISFFIFLILNRRAFEKMISFIPLSIRKRFGGSISKIDQSIARLQGDPKILILASIISMLRQIAICVSFFCAGKSFGINAEMAVYFVVIPIVMAVIVLPISINGLGLQDNTMIFLLGMAGIGSVEALFLSIFMHITRNITGIIGGILFALGHRRNNISSAVSKFSERERFL